MTACDKTRRRVLLEGSGELPAADRQALERHLAACPACRRFQEDARGLALAAPAALDARPPRLDAGRLEALAKQARPAVLPFRLPRLLAAAAALTALILGAALWLGPLRPEGAAAHDHPRIALLDEWQFWLVSCLGMKEGADDMIRLADAWNEHDFARHLLALEGLLPEELPALEENGAEPTPDPLPPITLRDCNTAAPLRS